MPKQSSLSRASAVGVLYHCRHMSGLQASAASVLQAAKARSMHAGRAFRALETTRLCKQNKNAICPRRGDRESARRTAWIPEFRTTILLAYTSSLCNVRPIIVQAELHGVV